MKSLTQQWGVIELVISRKGCYWFPWAWPTITHVVLLLVFHLGTIQCIGFPPCEKMEKWSQRLYSALIKCFFSIVFYISVSDLLFLSSCLFLPLVKKYLAYACPTVIWKQITSFEFTTSTLLWILLMVKVSWDSPWNLNFWDTSRRDWIWRKTV